MAARTFTLLTYVDDVLTNATSATVAVKRKADGVEVLAATAMTNTGAGTYTYASSDLFTVGVPYITTFTWVVAGATYSFEDDFVQAGSATVCTTDFLDDLGAAAVDPCHGFGGPVTVKRIVKGAMNTTTGVRAESATTYSVDAVRGEITTSRRGETTIETCVIAFRKIDVAGLDASEGWRIVDADAFEWEVVAVEFKVDRRILEAECRRAA